jgi:serine/threonine protein kinase/Tol biopolymer transport system component
MPLAAGTKLDGYEVLGLLGSGGMGEVYRARDPVLKREVAIKVLPSLVSQDPDRLRRFEQEAQAAAVLNHPNILAVHRFGIFEGAPYMVSELLVGDTLRQQLERGPLSVRKAIDYGVQIAHGLAAAHDKGIVHRDLKPENLFVTRDGRIKILDFGLAKLLPSQPDPEGSAPTQTQGTDPGMVLGTVGYMSPEQVRGKTADNRADIFAFGAILYEMLAGKRAFQRPTSAETMTAILNEDPPGISQIVHSAPTGLQRVVHRCLEKNPEQRFQSASDLAFALEALSESGNSPVTIVDGGSRSRWAWIAAAAGVVVAIAVLLIAWLRMPLAVPVVETVTQLTDDGKPKLGGMTSDSSRIYFNEGPPGAMKIAQVSISGGLTAPIETRLASPFVSDVAHDGSALLAEVGDYNSSSNSLWWIPLPAGDPRPLASGKLQDAGILPGDHILFAKGDDSKGADFFADSKDASNPRKLVSVPGNVYNVVVSPDGQRILFEVRENSNGVALLQEMAADGTSLREILKGNQLDGKCCFAWNSDQKYLVYVSRVGKESDIWALPTQIGLFRRLREPIRLTAGPLSYTVIFPNRDGKQIFAVASKERGELVRFDLKSHQFLPILSGISATEPTFSRDGKWVVYVSYPEHTLWRSRSDGAERMQLTYPPMEAYSPFISPDGKSVAFTSNSDAFLIDMAGGRPQRIFEKGGGVARWSPDGNLLLRNTFIPPDVLQFELQILDLRTRQTSVVPSSRHLIGPFWVNQDTLVAATDDHKKFLTFDFKTEKWSDLAAGNFMAWAVSPDGKSLYVVTGGEEPKLERVRVADHQIETITSLKDIHLVADVGHVEIAVAPDGSPVFTRDAGYQEIYSLNVRWP